MIKLSKAQRRMLAGCFRCTSSPETLGHACVFARGAGQHAAVRALERHGLIAFYDFGGDIDHEVDGDVPLFEATEEGVRVAFELGLADADDLTPGIIWGLRALTLGLDPYGRERPLSGGEETK